MSTYGRTYLLVLHDSGVASNFLSKQVITNSALHYRLRLGIPRTRCFTNRPADRLHFAKLKPASLAGVTIDDKLMIVAHGSDNEVGPFTTATLAKTLAQSGLTAAKLITFKACEVGTGTFLNRFLAQCNTRGISVGWLKGYMGVAATVPKGFLRPHERITDEDGNRLKGDDRVKIVRGNTQVAGMSARYA